MHPSELDTSLPRVTTFVQIFTAEAFSDTALIGFDQLNQVDVDYGNNESN